MATTETKTGFRLPWSSDRSEPTAPAPDASAEAGRAAVEPAHPSAEPVQEIETPEMIDAVPAATAHEAAVETPAGAPTAATPSATPSTTAPAARKPNKFMAELTRAMQSAAEAAREETLAKFAADAKAHIEGIHTEAATEATELRKQADDDVAGIRDWSKAEIARIREETDERIAHRKQNLEDELEEHTASIERRIERVQARVTSFETEMAGFFERLLAEEDPTRFAAMAEALPEPPPFDGPMPDRVATATPAAVPAPVAETPLEAAEAPVEAAEAPVPTASDAWGTPAADWGASPATTVDASTPSVAAPEPAWDAPIAPDPVWGEPEAQVAETPAPFAPGPTWGDPAGAADASDTPGPTEVAPAVGSDHGDLFGITAADVTPADVPAASPTDDPSAHDPRLSALGLPADFAAAEAEAADFTPNDDGSEDEVPTIPDDAIASRLAGLVPDDPAAESSVTTRVSVTGLISVASIAGFKRHLSRAPGVQSVGVSSGPDGEFVFAVVHAAEADLREVVTTLPGFGARVTGDTDGALTVAAHDPEAEG